MICFFIKPIISLAGNFLLSLSLHCQCSCWPFGHGSRWSYFLGAIKCHLELLTKLIVNIAATLDCLSYLHFSSTEEIGFHRDDHLHCLFISHLHVPFLMIIFDFFPVFIATTSIILYLLEKIMDSPIVFCSRRLKMGTSSRLEYFRYVILHLRYLFVNLRLWELMISLSNLLAPHFYSNFSSRQRNYQSP